MRFNSLSGRLLVLTVIFVMIAEVMIFVPSVARFRADYLQERLERAQIASLALLATPNDMVEPALERELLENAGVINIVLQRNEVRELVLAAPQPGRVAESFDMRMASPVDLIVDAMAALVRTEDRVIRVIGLPVQGGGSAIEITLEEAPLRDALIDYGLRILYLSLFISAVTATLLFVAVQLFITGPIRRVTDNITAFREAPEDPDRLMQPGSPVSDIAEAERALRDMQDRVLTALKQKDRLAALGSAVAKISHDLRNMLTTAQLVADRLEDSDDPRVRRTAPKLVGAISRAVNLCEATLAFGRSEEPPPEKRIVSLRPMVDEVFEAEQLACANKAVAFHNEVPPTAKAEADADQLIRVLQNLVRNARQAMEAKPEGGTVTVSATWGKGDTEIYVRDTGPGLPVKTIEHLFEPFQAAQRRGGTGLGLAICAELVRGHGGKLELVETTTAGTTFRLILPASGMKDGAADGSENAISALQR
ncbi:MAG: sensor histidine kinase [Rubricella sp.]